MKATQRFLLLFSVLLLVAGGAIAQGTTGSLNGTVSHEGTPLPGVTITITSPALQGARVAVSNVNGDFNFPALPPGEYVVQFEMDGMATVTKTVRVGLAKTERVNGVLVLSAMAEEITVTASAPAVIETTEVQANYESEIVENLPTPRTMQSIVQLAPGVSNTGPGGGQTGEGGNEAIIIAGGYAYDSLYLVNGAVTNENIRGQSEDLFIEDAIQETSVITGSISAEYGRFTGGVVSAITKSGGNEFSGSFRDSLTDPSWTSSSDAGEEKADSDLNETYEATLGGRIVRDRLWFFTAGRYVENTRRAFFINEEIAFDPPPVTTDERYEVKFTGQVGPKHSLVGSYLSYDVDQTPQCSFGCFDIGAVDVDGRQIPSEMITANYNGILTSSLLLEAGYSTRDLAYENGGGEHVPTDYTDARDIALGSLGYDWTYYGTWGTPYFCGVCDTETRENEYYNLKATYYLALPSLGTHNIVGGYENFSESRYANNYQSASNFTIYTYSGIAPTLVGNPNSPGNLRPVVTYGDVIYYWPVESLSQGSDFVTDSLFLNDKWDLSTKWSFNVGVRYDKNDGTDSSKNPISKDSNVSPRLGVIYDLGGDGRFRVNASYSRYVARIQEGVGGNAGGGSPSYYGYWYDGPDVGGPDSGMDSFDVMEDVIAWLLAQGWTLNTPTAPVSFFGASIPNLNQRMPGDLSSPAVDEFTIGSGMQIGTKGFARFDYVDKEWTDFYVLSTTPGDTVTDERVGTLDMVTYGNCSSCLTRTYQGIMAQAGYRFTDRLTLGGNYTWAETKGNDVGEWVGGGPIGDNIFEYVEYQAYDQRRPEGFLPTDSTHKARLWVAYDVPLGAIGSLNFSLLQRFDSGTPYSEVQTINVRDYVTCHPCGYETPDTTHAYYFSDRGEYRWDDVTSTDLAINYEVPSKVSFFVQGELINAFNEQAVVGGSASIRLLDPFDPFTDTPVEGVNWEKSSTFGQPTGPNSYQLPRTYRVSLGVRF